MYFGEFHRRVRHIWFKEVIISKALHSKFPTHSCTTLPREYYNFGYQMHLSLLQIQYDGK